MLAAVAAVAPAADPPPGSVPAPTRWTAAPAARPPAGLPPAPSPFPQLAPADGPAPDRTIVFQKPAGAGTGNAMFAPVPIAQTPAAPAQREPQPAAPPVGPGRAGGLNGQENARVLNDPSFATSPPLGLARDKVFQLTSDEQLRVRIARELAQEQYDRELRAKDTQPAKPDPSRQQAPETPGLGRPGEVYVTKAVREKYPAGQSLIEPNYVVHRRLYFEERNSERYGWDLGIVQPVVSTAFFFKDVLLYTAHAASYPFDRYDSSAGKCRPGDPVPYNLYPESISLFGAAVGAATYVGAAAILH